MADTSLPTRKLYTLAYVTAAALVGLVLGVLIAWAFFIDARRAALTNNSIIPNLSFTASSSASTNGPISRAPIETSRISGAKSLVVENQPAGVLVIVQYAAVDEGQWVVIHEDREGTLGNVLGAARFTGGTTEGAVELLRGTSAGSTYHAILYADNGDRAFSLSDDTPLSDASGSIKGITFIAQ